MANQEKTIEITKTICNTISEITKTAVKYEELTNRKLGVTGEIGEILACHKLKLKLLANPLSAGYDAIDNNGNRYQIKSRRAVHGRGNIGSFSKHDFDYAILVVFGKNYEVLDLRKTDALKLKPVLVRHPRRNPTFGEFKNISDSVLEK